MSVREMNPSDKLAITYDATAENVSRARAAIARLGEELGAEEPVLSDLKTVVTEACANVVLHAYPDRGGSFELEAFSEEGELAIVVRDFGTGLWPDLRTADESSMRIGLGLISQLSSHFGIGSGPHGGTEVRMRVRLTG
jgi:serine/threonine-protein kinase RsbW